MIAKPTPRQPVATAGDPDFMLSLARGLSVLRAFEHRPALTTSQAAQLTGLSRATVRRCLHTLEKLGYVAPRGNAFVLRPALLTLAHAYLTGTSLAEAAQPVLQGVRDRLAESCSLGVLDGDEVVYLARAETRRIMSIALHVGSRVPAYCTSMGRVLLAHLPPAQLDAYLSGAPFPRRTPHTRATQAELRRVLAAVRRRGYALVDQELELGLRSIAVPVRDAAGEVVGAMNVGAPAARVSGREMAGRVRRELDAGARELSRAAYGTDAAMR
ncbi:MAG TPA: IclR family transcriptional regulator C-terminal domain-containing protein [Gemmatimonadaceae bacterium]|nr:IclR family transcriptional regulator C-terminal domain-containing protein [Gemmatimonadaceae bacterium]